MTFHNMYNSEKYSYSLFTKMSQNLPLKLLAGLLNWLSVGLKLRLGLENGLRNGLPLGLGLGVNDL